MNAPAHLVPYIPAMRRHRPDKKASLLDRYGLYLVLAAAAIVRMVYLGQYNAMPDWEQLTVDANYHHHWAQDIASGDIFGDTTYFRAPLYAWCLGILYAIFGDSLWVGRLFGFAIGIGSVGMTYTLGKRLFGGTAGVAAGLIHALYMMAVYFEPELLVDPLYTLLLLVAMDRFVVWHGAGTARAAIVFAIWLGLAAITRPNALVMVPVALAAMLMSRKEASPRWMQIAALAIGLAITILPVTARNYLVAGDPTLIASSGGINLYIGNNPEADGISATLPPPLGPNWRIEQTVHIAQVEMGQELKPGEVSSYWTNEAMVWMRANPGKFLDLYATKAYLFFANTLISNNRELYQFIERAPILKNNPVRFAPVLGLAVIGLIAGAWRNRAARWLVVFVLLSVLSGAVFFYATRFRLPLLPVFFVAAGFGITKLWGCLRTHAFRGVIAMLAGAAAYLGSVSLPDPARENISTHALLEAGTYHYATGNYEQAMREFSAAQQIDPYFAGVNANIGAVLLQEGQVDSAIVRFRREIRNNPWYGRAWTNLAFAQLMKGDRMAADSAAREAISREPYAYSPNAAMLHAIAADSVSGTQGILNEALAGAERTHNDVYLLTEAGDLLMQREALAEAGVCYRMALEAQPPAIEMDHEAFRAEYRNSEKNVNQQQARAAIQLSYIEGMAGRANEAIALSERAIELAPEMPEAYLNLVGGYRAVGNAAGADSVLREAEKRFPGNPNVQGLLRQK